MQHRLFTKSDTSFLYTSRPQPGPDSIGIVAISHSCSGVAARACGLVNLEPMKVKDLYQVKHICYCSLTS